MENDINAWAPKGAGCKVGEPTQDARAHAKCADPRKVRIVLWTDEGSRSKASVKQNNYDFG